MDHINNDAAWGEHIDQGVESLGEFTLAEKVLVAGKGDAAHVIEKLYVGSDGKNYAQVGELDNIEERLVVPLEMLEKIAGTDQHD